MHRREHIPCPYRAYNGATVTCQAHIGTYNRIQDAINGWLDAGREPPEWLLNESHRHFALMADIAKEREVEQRNPWDGGEWFPPAGS